MEDFIKDKIRGEALQKKNNKNGQLIYKIVSTCTLLVPLPLYLFLVATLFSITADYIVYTDIENVEVIAEVVEQEETYFLTTTDNSSMDGLVEFKNNRYGITITDKDIIKIGKTYYSYVLQDDVRQLVDIRKFEVQKHLKIKPISSL